MKSSVPCCASCGSVSIVKAGHNSSGTQQYFCKVCGAHRVLVVKSPVIDPERKALILWAVEVERVFGVARQTIAKWLEKKPKVSRR